MGLFIRDDGVDALAKKVQRALGVRTKTEAVRLALSHELDRANAAKGFDERNADLLARVASFGEADPDFNMKAFTDEMWGDV